MCLFMYFDIIIIMIIIRSCLCQDALGCSVSQALFSNGTYRSSCIGWKFSLTYQIIAHLFVSSKQNRMRFHRDVQIV